MEKITPAVIIALVVGVVLGYLVRTLMPASNLQPQIAQESEIQASSIPIPAGKIPEALSAAPESVAKNATVLDYPAKEGEAPVELQKGTNDWTCFPDYPGSPGKDPMCLDKQGMVWLQAYLTQQSPGLAQAGLAYMLAGGSDASNTDPFAQKPTEGED